MIPTPQEAIWVPGPWEHQDVSANGTRFHTVSMGEGPLVLLLHGFPMYWWTWRRALPALAANGYRAVAMDLRGYGGSDHTPHGYDPVTLAADAAGVVRSLGAQNAVIVGHGWGGLIAWSAAVMRPDAVRAIVPVSMPHPNLLRRGITSDAQQRKLSKYVIGFQWPISPERGLVKHDAQAVADLLQRWSGTPHWPDDETRDMFRAAFQFGSTAHCALEYHRWAMRSIPRPDGRRFAKRMEFPIKQSVLQINGQADNSILPRISDGSEHFVRGPYERIDLPGVGHFPHEESPDRFTEVLMRWLGALD